MKDFNNIPDKEFDDLFKKLAENAMTESDESAWDKMESLLNDSDNDKGMFALKKPLIYGGIILLFLSLVFMVYYRIQESNHLLENKNENEKGIESVNRVEVINNEIEGSIEDKLNTKGNTKSNIKTVLEPLALNDLIIPKSRYQVDSDLPFISAKNILINEVNNLSLIKKLGSTGKADYSKGIEEFIGEIELIADKKGALELNELTSKGFNYYLFSLSPNTVTTPVRKEIKLEIENFSKWNVRLGFSPDFSAVPHNSFFKIGHNWSAMVEYRLNERWAVQSGIIKSLKFYVADPERYLWPDKWGAKPDQLNRIDARCNMLDIPLNVRYDFSTGRNKWFVQSGLTSYLMLNEKYDYVYASNYTNQTWQSWEGKTGFYVAAEANVSFGVERKIGKRMTIQAEPFFKAPLANVGFGNVKLITTGLFISSKIELGK